MADGRPLRFVALAALAAGLAPLVLVADDGGIASQMCLGACAAIALWGVFVATQARRAWFLDGALGVGAMTAALGLGWDQLNDHWPVVGCLGALTCALAWRSTRGRDIAWARRAAFILVPAGLTLPFYGRSWAYETVVLAPAGVCAVATIAALRAPALIPLALVSALAAAYPPLYSMEFLASPSWHGQPARCDLDDEGWVEVRNLDCWWRHECWMRGSSANIYLQRGPLTQRAVRIPELSEHFDVGGDCRAQRLDDERLAISAESGWWLLDLKGEAIIARGASHRRPFPMRRGSVGAALLELDPTLGIVGRSTEDGRDLWHTKLRREAAWAQTPGYLVLEDREGAVRAISLTDGEVARWAERTEGWCLLDDAAGLMLDESGRAFWISIDASDRTRLPVLDEFGGAGLLVACGIDGKEWVLAFEDNVASDGLEGTREVGFDPVSGRVTRSRSLGDGILMEGWSQVRDLSARWEEIRVHLARSPARTSGPRDPRGPRHLITDALLEVEIGDDWLLLSAENLAQMGLSGAAGLFRAEDEMMVLIDTRPMGSAGDDAEWVRRIARYLEMGIGAFEVVEEREVGGERSVRMRAPTNDTGAFVGQVLTRPGRQVGLVAKARTREGAERALDSALSGLTVLPGRLDEALQPPPLEGRGAGWAVTPSKWPGVRLFRDHHLGLEVPLPPGWRWSVYGHLMPGFVAPGAEAAVLLSLSDAWAGAADPCAGVDLGETRGGARLLNVRGRYYMPFWDETLVGGRSYAVPLVGARGSTCAWVVTPDAPPSPELERLLSHAQPMALPADPRELGELPTQRAMADEWSLHEGHFRHFAGFSWRAPEDDPSWAFDLPSERRTTLSERVLGRAEERPDAAMTAWHREDARSVVVSLRRDDRSWREQHTDALLRWVDDRHPLLRAVPETRRLGAGDARITVLEPDLAGDRTRVALVTAQVGELGLSAVVSAEAERPEDIEALLAALEIFPEGLAARSIEGRRLLDRRGGWSLALPKTHGYWECDLDAHPWTLSCYDHNGLTLFVGAWPADRGVEEGFAWHVLDALGTVDDRLRPGTVREARWAGRPGLRKRAPYVDARVTWAPHIVWGISASSHEVARREAATRAFQLLSDTSRPSRDAPGGR